MIMTEIREESGPPPAGVAGRLGRTLVTRPGMGAGTG